MQSVKLIILFLLTSFTMEAQTFRNFTISPYNFENNSGEIVEAEFGKFSVKQNHFNEQSKDLELAFVRFSATENTNNYPIVYLAGGPGGSGTATAKGKRFPLFMALRKTADVIAFDQRGTGLSEAFPSCSVKTQVPIDIPGSEEAYLEVMNQILPSCLEEWNSKGFSLEHFNTKQSAADLEALREALGVEKLNLWGISYGTHLAMAYMKYYPDRVAKAVLTGIEGLDQTVKEPAHVDQYFERVNEMMQSTGVYRSQIPNLTELMREVFTALEKNPQIVETTNPRTKEAMKVGIGKFDVQLFTSFFLVKNPDQLQRLPLLFLSMKAGDYSQVAPYIAMLKMYAGQFKGMPLAMDAMSGISVSKRKAIERQAKTSLLGNAHNFPFPGLWKHLDIKPLPQDFRKKIEFNANTLIFSGELDGRTPLESTAEVIDQFTNAHTILVKNAGHDLFMSAPEVTENIMSFFSGETITTNEIHTAAPFSFVKP